MMIGGFRFYSIYRSIHLHFTTDYDALKYGSNTKKITIEAYENRKDLSIFEFYAGKIQSTQDALKFCVFNFANGDKTWLYEDYPFAEAIYNRTSSYYFALNYNLKKEMSTIDSIMAKQDIPFSTLITITKTGNRPPLLQLVLTNGISKEFICLLDNGFIDIWCKEYENDPLISGILENLQCYKPFVKLFSRVT